MTITMAPLIAGGKVLVGNSGGEMGVRGWLTALDLGSGRIAWRAYSTGPDRDVLIGPRFKPFDKQDQGTDLGVSTWAGEGWKTGGGTVYGRYGRTGYGASVFYVFTTAVHTGILGALFTLGTSPFYQVYIERAPDSLGDQQLAGLVMWIPAGLVLTMAGIGLFAAWLGEAERRSQPSLALNAGALRLSGRSAGGAQAPGTAARPASRDV